MGPTPIFYLQYILELAVYTVYRKGGGVQYGYIDH
jgi:hypothetical protein